MKARSSTKNSQKGVVLVIVVIGLVAIIALAGLALDLSHAYVDKTKMQHALDAAAMSAAMTLIKSDGNTASATNDALSTFDEDVSGTELSGLTPTVEFSPTLVPFNTGGADPQFVRVKIRDNNRYNMPTWLAKVIGKDTIKVTASAVSGPVSASPCTLTPLAVCADPADTDCEVNGINNSPDDGDDGMCFGYKVWEEGDDPNECYLKTGTGGSGDTDQQTGVNCGAQAGTGLGTGQESDIGSGNYQLLDLSKLEALGAEVDCDGGGASYLACAFCKDIHFCPGDLPLPTLPGNTVGPTAFGVNTNFGDYGGMGLNADECPADTVPQEGLYSEYIDASGLAGNRRRIKSIAIVDCTGTGNGKTDLDVMTLGCFFLTQKAAQGGGQRVWGQFVGGGCSGNEISLNPSFAQKIILYKDPDSNDS